MNDDSFIKGVFALIVLWYMFCIGLGIAGMVLLYKVVS